MMVDIDISAKYQAWSLVMVIGHTIYSDLFQLPYGNNKRMKENVEKLGLSIHDMCEQHQ